MFLKSLLRPYSFEVWLDLALLISHRYPCTCKVSCNTYMVWMICNSSKVLFWMNVVLARSAFRFGGFLKNISGLSFLVCRLISHLSSYQDETLCDGDLSPGCVALFRAHSKARKRAMHFFSGHRNALNWNLSKVYTSRLKMRNIKNETNFRFLPVMTWSWK